MLDRSYLQDENNSRSQGRTLGNDDMVHEHIGNILRSRYTIMYSERHVGEGEGGGRSRRPLRRQRTGLQSAQNLQLFRRENVFASSIDSQQIHRHNIDPLCCMHQFITLCRTRWHALEEDVDTGGEDT